ncbi:hypothetical protein I302_108136 [Kwoniella bestiolae CBS 10118]|uniref:Uncharacterized protein n=1 Tax=Kwoniella bestiolae CBS 10118 TaxID=1296100 RepID=A0A1B9FWJ2_9TREE|nr:hypothetical protein I302_07498 [Kwoniella bestiolae CBS 10118]OCF23145.1 hypothetical protein I302_07498 [Kwoniella bestiolae CBS 10118]
MSFIGSGELEHKVTQLQRQLDHKDHELNSIKNEQRKKDEDLTNARRAKEDAEYKLSNEADRALQAEKTLTANTKEITQLKLKLSNLESSLSQATEKLKKEEKDNERIQNALDVALNSGTDGAAQQIKTLQSRTKQLEDALRSAEQEKDRLRNQGSSNDPWGSGEPLTRGERNRLMVLQNQVESLREENARLQASGPSKSTSSSDIFSSSSPPRPKTKRRSMSVSSPAPSELIELENQVKALQEQLMNRKVELDKAVNEKLAMEITSKKKLGKMESDMDDIKEELDFYRRNQDGAGPSSKEEVEKVKKAMRSENEQLQIRLKAKEDEIVAHVQQISSLEKKVEEIGRLEADLEKERSLRKSFEISQVDPSIPSSQLQEAEEKIQSLQAELIKARSTTSTSSSKGGDMEIRQVKRELQKALRDKEYLESLVKENDELLAEKDEEIQRMKTAIPVPGSPVLGAQVDDGRIQELEDEKMVLEEQFVGQKEKYEEEIRDIEGRLEAVTAELEDVKKVEQELLEKLTAVEEESKASIAQQQFSEAQIKAISEQLASKEEELSTLNSELDQLRDDLREAQTAASTAQQDLNDTRNKVDEVERSLSDKERLLDDLLSQRDELQFNLTTRSRDDAEFASLEDTLKDTRAELANLQAELASLENDKGSLEEAVADAKHQSGMAVRQIDDLTANLAAVAKQLDNTEEKAKVLSGQKDETIRSLNDQLDDLKADISSLQIKLDDKIAELAESSASHDEVQNRFEQAVKSLNEVQAKLAEVEEAQTDRSTESEAREKDEELFQLKEARDKLSKDLQIAHEEYGKELASNTFKSQQDLLEAQGRVQQLEKQVHDLQSALSSAQQSKSSVTSDNETVHRMEQKISQLRNERDDLRHNLSFVQNERHFAIRAANTDKEAALEDVRKVKEELKQNTAAYEKLQVELEEVRRLLGESEAQIGEVDDEEKSLLHKKLASLENQLATQSERVKTLESQLQSKEESLLALQTQLQSAEKRAEGLQKELLEMVNHVGQTTKLSDPPRHSPTFEENNDLPTDLVSAMNNGEGRSRRTSLGHMRSRSNVSANMMQNLNVERQLQAKIGRRDARIAELTHDLEKANLNLTLAKEAQEETLEEITDLTEERDRLQAELQQASANVEEVEIEDPEAIRGMVLALVMYRTSVKSAESRWHVASELLAKSRAAANVLQETLFTAQQQSSEDAQRLDSLQGGKAALEAQVASSQAEEAASRSQLEEARQAIDNLQSRLATYEAASVSATESAAALTAIEDQVTEKEERIRDLNAQNVEYTTRIESLERELSDLRASRDEELASLNSKTSELEAELKNSQDKVKDLQIEKDGLGEEITAAEKALEEGMIDASAEKEKMEERYREVELRVAELEGQLREKIDQLEEGTRKFEEVQKELEDAQIRVRDLSTASEDDGTAIQGLREELVVLREASQGDSSAVTQLRQELAALEETSRSVEVEKNALMVEITQLKNVVDSTNDRSDLTKKQLDETVIELEEARRAKAGIDELVEQVRRELASSEESRKAIESSLEEITSKMDELSNELVAVKQELAAKTQQLQSALNHSEKQQADLEKLRAENAELRAELEKAQSVAPAVEVDQELVADLKERVEQLETSLTQKTEEVDEADDRTREAFKTNAKLEKKLGKLQRQLEAALVEKNTALNKLATQPQPQVVTSSSSAPVMKSAAPSQPPSAPVSTQAVKPRVASAPSTLPPTQTQRTPLSSVNIFQPSPNTHTSVSPARIPTSGHKRHREDDPVKPLPTVDAILQAPTKTISPHKARSSFTPQRGLTTGGNLDIAKQKPAFPLPPTRSVFQPR